MILLILGFMSVTGLFYFLGLFLNHIFHLFFLFEDVPRSGLADIIYIFNLKMSFSYFNIQMIDG